MGVPSITKPPYTPCAHATAQGCGIYDSRPCEECRGYYCLWLAEDTPEIMEPLVKKLGPVALLLDEKERPDQSGVLLEASGLHTPSEFEKQTGTPFLVAREVFPNAFALYRGEKLLKRLTKRRLVLLAYESGTRAARGPAYLLDQFAAFLKRLK
jgi:hypothetical protein